MTHSDNICLICLECKNDEGKKCYKMSSIFNYIKQCNCDCIVHSSCLHQWHTLENNKCIIVLKIEQQNKLFEIILLLGIT